MKMKIALLISIASLALLTVGLNTELSLGDEVYHYRFAKNMYYAGERVAFDPIYGTGLAPGYFYNSDPLWNILLAVIWRILGTVSFTVAQIYHTFYYALLILFTYLLAKERQGEEEGFYAALIVATAPVTVAFSILFYTDVPVTALSIAFLYLLYRRKYLLGGLLLGLMYVMKRNSWFLLPGVLIIILLLQDNPGLKAKIKILAVLGIACLIFVLPDFYWRETNFRHFGEKTGIPPGGVGTVRGAVQFLLYRPSIITKEFLNSHVLNPFDLAKYLGIPLLTLSVFYLLFKRRKEDFVFWIPLLSYLIFFFLLFGINSDVRYLLPMVPLLAIFSGRAAVLSKKPWIKGLILFLCGFQLLSSSLFVYSHRKIPEEIKKGFVYIRANTPSNVLIMYPEYILSEATERKFVWSSFHGMKDLFWGNDKEIKKVLERNQLDYILIKKSRVYDDSEKKHFGGYPFSFVLKLPNFPFLKKVFTNDELELWKVVLMPESEN